MQKLSKTIFAGYYLKKMLLLFLVGLLENQGMFFFTTAICQAIMKM